MKKNKIINRFSVLVLFFVFTFVLVGCKTKKQELEIVKNIELSYNQDQNEVLIEFDEVSNASSYKAYIYSDFNKTEVFKTYEISINNKSIKGLNDGSYIIELQALGEGKYLDSKISNENKQITVVKKIEIEENNASDFYGIIFEGINNIDVNYNSNYNVLSNVRVKGTDEATYLVNIRIESSIVLDDGNKIPLNYKGSVSVKYFASYAGYSINATRTINVLDEALEAGKEALGDNLIVNGDFKAGTNNFSISNHDGASSSMEIKNEELTVKISTLNWSNSSSPRLETKEQITLEKGKTYKVSFDAKASMNKKVLVQIGELLTTSPWFINHSGSNVFDITTTKEEYSFNFTYLGETTNKSTLLFEMGIVNGDLTIADITYDNIKVQEYLTTLEDLIPPTINGSDEMILYINTASEYDVLTGINALDNIDGDLTNRIIYKIYENDELVRKIDLTKESEYLVYYQVYDNSYNYTEVIRSIKVSELEEANKNLILNGDFSLGLKNFEISQHEGGYADYIIENGVLTLKMEGINWNYNSSSPRLSTIEKFTLIKGQSYKVSFSAMSKEDKKILVQIGCLISDSPYFINYKEDTLEIIRLNDQMQTYEFYFTYQGENTEEGTILFELGYVDNDSTITDISFDNISIVRLESVVKDYKKPEIIAYDKLFYEGEITSFDFLKNVIAIDDTDGDISNKVNYEILLNNKVVDKVDYNVAGIYEIRYNATDLAGNKGIKGIKFQIYPKNTELHNLNKANAFTLIDDNDNNQSSLTFENNKTIVTLGNISENKDLYLKSNNLNFNALYTYAIILDIESNSASDINLEIARLDNLNSYYQVLYKNISIYPNQTRYLIEFKVSTTFNDYQLKIDLSNSSNSNSIITISNLKIIEYSYSLTVPVGIVINPVPNGGHVFAFANVDFAKGYRLYVYKNNNELYQTFIIMNGQFLPDLKLPSGNYILKVQAVGDGLVYKDSNLSNGINYSC